MEVWQSGLSRHLGKVVTGKKVREFESHYFRQKYGDMGKFW